MNVNKIKLATILFMSIFIFYGCDLGNSLNIGSSHKELVKQKKQKNTNEDINQAINLKQYFLIDKNEVDFNLDGKKEKVFFVGTKIKGDEINYQNPVLFIYENPYNNKTQKIEYYTNGAELHTGLLQIRYCDIDGDSIPEIFYSYNLAMPELHVEEPHLLKFNKKTGAFVDINISSEYNFTIAHWDTVDYKNSGLLWLDIYTNVDMPERNIIKYFKLSGNKLVENKKMQD